MIEVLGLTKIFDEGDEPVVAIEDVTFSCSAGEVFGLIGPNGAGKTTTLRILSTMLKPTRGTARVAGADVVREPDAVRARIGFMSATTGVYDRMTAWEMVEYFGRLYGLTDEHLYERMETLFERLQLNSFRNVLGARMSTGMKQKVSIARTLIHDPPVLIFDEPTAGLDVLVARAVLDCVAELKSEGKCIVFSTHNMSEVERLCDRVAIIHRGKILAMGSLDELRDRYGEHDLEELFFALIRQADAKALELQ